MLAGIIRIGYIGDNNGRIHRYPNNPNTAPEAPIENGEPDKPSRIGGSDEAGGSNTWTRPPTRPLITITDNMNPDPSRRSMADPKKNNANMLNAKWNVSP